MFQSIRGKVAAVVIAATLSSVIFASLASAWREASRRIAAKTGEMQAIAGTLATAVSPSLAAGDRHEVARVLGAIGRIPGISFARVTNGKGEIVHQYGLGIVVGRELGPIDANAQITPLSPLYLATYPVEAPVMSGGVAIGKVTLIADLSSLRDALIESLATALLAGIAAACGGILLSRRLQGTITEPVTALARAMEEIGRTRDYSRSVAATSRDEVGALVASFNGMMREIGQRDAALAASRDSLEIEVAERTRELVLAKAAADHANAAKSDFLATMSHEIRTPMNGMLVMAELMAAGDLPPRSKRYAGTLVKSGQSLLAIINDILDFSKIEAGKLDIEEIPTSPSAVVDDIVRLFHEKAAEKGIELMASCAPDVPRMIVGDPVRLSQIITNLVNNALKFTSKGSVAVRISLETPVAAQPPLLSIAVTDTGIGIAADKLATIFDPFSQEDASTTRRFGGTGIGLAISNRLAAAMGGSISVSSVQGTGSTFTLTIPARIIEGAAALSAIDPARRVVTVALPEGPIRESLCQALTDRGFTVSLNDPSAWASASGIDAVAVFADAAACASLSDQDSGTALRIALAPFSDDRATGLLERGQADLILPLPLTSGDLEDCLAMIADPATVRGVHPFAGRARDQRPLDGALPFAGVHVLAADDSAVNREVLGEALGRLGVQVTSVEDGRAAVDAAIAGGFDLIFMDASMPVMDGFEAARAIRAHEAARAGAAVPIVALTAHVVGAGAVAWREAGMSDCVTKPFTLASIEACLQRWLGDRAPATAAAQQLASADEPSPAAGTGPGPAQAQAQAQAPDVSLLDPNVIESIRAMQAPGDDLVDRIIGLYIIHAPKALGRLERAVGGSSAKETADAAHALKSLSRNMGARAVGDLCDGIEISARSGQAGALHADVAAVAIALSQTLAALKPPGRVDQAA